MNIRKLIKKHSNSTENQFKKTIKRLRATSLITKSGEKFLIKFLKKNGSIVYINDFQAIINRVRDDAFHQLCNKLFPHAFELIHNPNIIVNHFKKSIMTDDQLSGITKIIELMFNPRLKTFGLYGFAGTGKTTLITELIHYLIDNKYINSVVFSAPTHKAVNVMKNKFLSKSTLGLENSGKVTFQTIHKLFGYRGDYDVEGNKIFVKSGKVKLVQDIIVIDECSMIASNLIHDIFNASMNNNNNTKIIFIGDPAQLPPVNETKSIIFDQPHKNITLQKIVRSSDDNVINLCNSIRSWVINSSKSRIKKFKGAKVKIYKNDKKRKIDTTWFNEYSKAVKNGNKENIILTWTNKQSHTYNNEIRKTLFGNKLRKYEPGDVLVFNTYYSLKTKPANPLDPIAKEEFETFYTSEQIKVSSVKDNQLHPVQRFKIPLPSNCYEINNLTAVQARYTKTLKLLNDNINKQYKVWQLIIKKIKKHGTSDAPDKLFVLTVIKDFRKLKSDKEFAHNQIKKLINEYTINHPNQINLIKNLIIKNLWKEYNEIFVDPFADIVYGNSQTVHKSQGSSYDNVYIDSVDILKNKNINDGKRCIYTAVTRTSNEVHILV